MPADVATVTDPAELRDQILRLTREYSEAVFASSAFDPQTSPVPVAGKVLDGNDIANIVDSALDGWLTSGRWTADFERMLARRVGMRHARMVNSGSSANLVALSALTSPKLGRRALVAGDEVLTVAMGFPTTFNPIIQNGLKPVVVDIDPLTYQADVTALREAIGPRTRAIMMAHTLGNPFDLGAVTAMCKEHKLWLIEDSCDALGSTYDGKPVGSFGDLSTFSFYPAHHITTGEGGAVAVRSPLVRRQVESFRDWGRDCYCDTGQDNTCEKRFDWQLGDLPHGYDHKYIYSHIGYNLKATDLQAALGVSQLAKLDSFVAARKANFAYLHQHLSAAPEFVMPVATANSDPAWFGFPITLSEDASFTRRELLAVLTDARIGTRLLFGSNLLRQPAYRDVDVRVVGPLTNSDVVVDRSFWIGVYPGLGTAELDYVISVLLDFAEARR